jgi:hypothetical protein
MTYTCGGGCDADLSPTLPLMCCVFNSATAGVAQLLQSTEHQLSRSAVEDVDARALSLIDLISRCWFQLQRKVSVIQVWATSPLDTSPLIRNTVSTPRQRTRSSCRNALGKPGRPAALFSQQHEAYLSGTISLLFAGAALTRERSVAGNSWSTYQRTDLGRDGDRGRRANYVDPRTTPNNRAAQTREEGVP